MQSFQTSSLPLRFFALCLITAGVFSLVLPKANAQCGGTGVPSRVTSSGTEFLICFMQNDTTTDASSEYQDIYLASVDTSKIDTVVITCNAYPALKDTFYLTPDSPSHVWRVSTDPAVTNFGIIISSNTIDEMVFRVVATSSTTCYGMNSKSETADAFLAFPKNVSGPEYAIMSYASSATSSFQFEPRSSEFCVAAFEDNTSILIIPSAPVHGLNKNGAPTGQIVPAQTELHFILNAGECVQIQTPADINQYDLTGSIVREVDSPIKPIVVYGGHARAEVPAGWGANTGNSSRDHMAEAMPPVSDWGTFFLTRNFSDPKGRNRRIGDFMRVLAKADNTIVTINGNPWGKPFAKYEFRDTLIDIDTAIPLNNIAAVAATNPILVGMIAHTAVGNGANGKRNGDPFLAIVPPLDQVFNDYTYFISENADFFPSLQFLVVVTEQSNTGNIEIDGNPIPSSFFINVPYLLNGKKYAILTIGQTGGIHRITCPPNNGLSILAYGWGDVISYGYTAGSLFKPTNGLMSLPTPTHSVVPNPGHPSLPPPSITIRDIMNERVYFDSVKVTYTQNAQNNTVRLKKDLVMDIGFMGSAEEMPLELTTSKPVTELITGSIRIWYHSAQWFDMYPVDFPFTITPQPASAGVNDQIAQSAYLENYPNPSIGRTTVHFWLPSRASVSVRIYDALGRTVRTVMQGMTNGEETLQVNTKGLPAGDYTLELLAPELGISKHTHVVVIE